MAKLTTQEIEAICKRAEKASAGPWLHAGGKFGEPVVTSYRDGINITEEVIYDFDAEFIANAREDIPKLLAEITRLHAMFEEEISEKEHVIMAQQMELDHLYAKLNRGDA